MRMEIFLDGSNGITGYSLAAQLQTIAAKKIRWKRYRERFRTRTLSEIDGIIQKTKFKKSVQRRALRFFSVLTKAEATVHRTTPGRVHLHEVARRENIYRVLAIFSLLDKLRITECVCSPINTGRGMVKTAHGRLRVPTPATRELLRGMPVFRNGRGELTTPTGACWAKVLCTKFGKPPEE
jgi:uncharacterized protein (DUF111 family)